MKHRKQPQDTQRQLPAELPSRAALQWRARRSRWFWQVQTRSLRFAKRTLDLVVVLPALLLLAPWLGAVALAIYLYDRGPVLYWQRRVGLHGVEFAFPKFRSMCVNADALRAQILAQNQHGSEGVTFKMKHDPRITPLGRFIRRFSIDELPQLWCVLRGDMSLVGPRPPIPSEVERYRLHDHQRLTVKPGLTCIWQVSGRSEIPFDQQVLMDIDYIQKRSLWNDFKLLLKTIPAVLFGRGSY